MCNIIWLRSLNRKEAGAVFASCVRTEVRVKGVPISVSVSVSNTCFRILYVVPNNHMYFKFQTPLIRFKVTSDMLFLNTTLKHINMNRFFILFDIDFCLPIKKNVYYQWLRTLKQREKEQLRFCRLCSHTNLWNTGFKIKYHIHSETKHTHLVLYTTF